jgi:hypothetical protein
MNDPFAIYGRHEPQERLARLVADEQATVVYGLAGIGKSALVNAVCSALEPRVWHCTVDCDRERTASRARAALAVALLGKDADTADPVRVHDAVLAHLRALTRPALIVLENFETLWEEEDRGDTYALLKDLLEHQWLALVVAMRTSALPQDFDDGTWEKMKLTGLPRDAAVELFVSRVPNRSFDREDLTDFVVTDLEGVPLAITLVANAAKVSQRATLNELRQEVEQVRASTPLNLGDGRTRSLDASLQISIGRLDDQGKRLLALLGVLPAGIAESDRSALAVSLDGFPDIERQAARLAELGLAFIDPDGDRRLRTLKPIRDYSAYAHWPRRGDLDTTRTHYLEQIGGATGTAADRRRARSESPNFTSMAATLPDRVQHCEALIRQGAAELDAADARETFRAAAAVARRAREPVLLARAALGISGGLKGPGHSLDRADEERLALLREAAAVLDGDEPLKLQVLTRLLGELHFDASREAGYEMERVRKQARDLDAHPKVADHHEERLQFALLELATVNPEQDLRKRTPHPEEVIKTAQALGDVKSEIKARHLLVSFLLELGENAAAEEQRRSASLRIPELRRQGDRDAAEWQDGVMRRARLLFAGEFDQARQALEEERRPEGEQADSPYRRWLHQNVLLTLDTGHGAGSQASDEVSRRIDDVRNITDQLRDAECRKFALSKERLRDLAYEWWPTWRATLALLLTARGSTADQEEAHDQIRQLSGPVGASPFDRILRHEYYVQVLALITLTVQRLCALAAADGSASENRFHSFRRSWGVELDRLLAPFDGRVVVPGSGVMNLGPVETFRAMAKGCAEAWGSIDDAFDDARERNIRLGGRPALVRTLVADAETHLLAGGDQGTARAKAAATEAAERATDLGMEPWKRRAEAVLERCMRA